MRSIQVVGHLTVDITPGLAEATVPEPGVLAEVGPALVTLGGAVGNCGRTLARLGAPSYVAGALGDDALGRLAADVLERQHPGHCDLTVVAGGATGYSVVIEAPSYDRAYWHHPGVNATYELDCRIRADGVVHAGYPPLMAATCADSGRPVADLFERAHAAGCATSLDLAYVADASPVRDIDWGRLLDRLAPVADLMCPSAHDLARLAELSGRASLSDPESAAAELLGQGASMVLVTAGGAGAHLRTGSAATLARLAAATGIDAEAWACREQWYPPPRVDRVRTAGGAGDTYKAALLCAMCRGDDPEAALDFARSVTGDYLNG